MMLQISNVMGPLASWGAVMIATAAGIVMDCLRARRRRRRSGAWARPVGPAWSTSCSVPSMLPHHRFND